MRSIRALRVLLAAACLLLAVMLVSCGSNEAVSENTVTEVSLKGDRMEVKASLTEDFLENFEGDEICLLELTSDMDATSDLRELIPLGTCKPKSRPSFSFDLFDGVRTRLYSTFVLASYDEEADEYVLLTDAAGVSEEELTRGGSTSDEGERSIKGISSAEPAEAIRLGVSHTVIRVQMDKLLLDGWQEGAVPYIWNGTTRYLNGEMLETLDADIAAYSEANVHVYLQFALAHDGVVVEDAENGDTKDTDKPVEEAVGVPREIYPAGVARVTPVCPVNMADRTSADIMEGFFNFMASRYVGHAEEDAEPFPYDAADVSFIIGDDVNEGGGFADGKGMMLAEYVTNYEKLVRLANIAVKSHDPSGRVYISLSSRRSGGGQGTAGKWSIHSFLTAFTAETRARGNYSWHVACDLYADMPTVWLSDPTTDSNRVTARSVDSLTDLLEGAKYHTPDEQMRRVVLTEYRIPSVTEGVEAENRQAASYAYAYRKAIANGHVEALIYGCYEDDDKAASGLRVDVDVKEGGEENALAGKMRAIYEVFTDIDTSASGDVDEAVSKIIKDAYEDLLQDTGGVYAVERVSGNVSADSYRADKGKDAWMSFRGGDLHGFEGASSLSYLELRRSSDADFATLHARFDRSEIADPMGISTRLTGKDLTGKARLHIDLYAGCVDEDARASVPVTLCLERPATGKTADGRGKVIYEATAESVRGGKWQTVTFDISDFEDFLHSSDDVILSVWIDDDSGTSYELGIDAIRADGGAESVLAIILIVLLVTALLAGVTVAVIFFIRRRGEEKRRSTPARTRRRSPSAEDGEEAPPHRAPAKRRKAPEKRRSIAPDIDDGATEDYYGGSQRRTAPPEPDPDILDEDGYYDD